jgi:hypothetical protein
MKASNMTKVAKIAQINPKKVVELQDYLAEVMGYFNIEDSKWDTLSDEYILHLCEQYEEEVF